MEIVAVVIISVVISLIKTLKEEKNKPKPVAQPKPTTIKKYPVEPKENNNYQDLQDAPQKAPYAQTTLSKQTVKKQKKSAAKYKDIVIDVQVLDGEEIDSEGLIFENSDDVVKGVIMKEILDSPRFKNPYKLR